MGVARKSPGSSAQQIFDLLAPHPGRTPSKKQEKSFDDAKKIEDKVKIWDRA